MSEEKIHISWNDVQDPKIDLRIKQQQTLQRAQQHFEQQATQSPWPTSQPATSRSRRFSSHGVMALALFGLIGGVGAWGLEEIVELAMPNQLMESLDVAREEALIDEARAKGNLSVAEANAAKDAINSRFAANPYVRILNDSSLPQAQKDKQLETLFKQDKAKNFIQQMLFFVVIAVAIAIGISVADPILGRNPRGVVMNALAAMVLGIIGGILVSLFINRLYNAMGGGAQDMISTRQIMARAIGWGILGLFIAVAPGIVMRSWKRSLIGLVGGLLGGVLGGLLFDPVSMLTGNAVVSRFVAIAAIGSITAAGTGIIEQVAKSGWLRVTTGLIAGKQFILYRNPTSIGSSPQCEIYLFKDPQIAPRHAAVHRVPGGFEIEDCHSASGTFVNGRGVQRSRLRDGDQIQIGGTSLAFQEKRALRQ